MGDPFNISNQNISQKTGWNRHSAFHKRNIKNGSNLSQGGINMKYLYKRSGKYVDFESHENLDLEIVTPQIRGLILQGEKRV